ncbi:MAG: hypothetical protein E3J75_04660, partial [Dehalococcoidia bacterium]
MAKRKANIRSKSRRKPKGRQSENGLFHFSVPRVVWRTILVVIIVAVLVWQRSALISLATSIRDYTWGLFGWGLLLIIIAIGILSGVLWQRKHSPLICRFRQWLGGIAFTLAIWGILAFSDLGGKLGLSIIGQDIVDYPISVSVLRIAGLVFVGVILVAPGACLRAAKKAASWLHKQFQRRPAPRPAPQPEPTPPPIAIAPVPQQIEAERQTITTPPAPTQAQQELRQVAQEVWKKYGEVPSLVTEDGWRLPPIDILDRAPEVEFSQADNMERARLIEEALASYGVEAKVVQINAGPTVTQFGVEPGWDRKMKEIKE